MTHDLTILDALRPDDTALDEQWSRATLSFILSTPAEPSTSTWSSHRVAPRARRARTVVAGAVGVGLLGAGAAAAVALTPQSFTDTFSGWGQVSPEYGPGGQAVDPATAERVAVTEGPGGTVFSLLAAPGQSGFACVAVLFETPASASAPEPSDFVDADGSSCAAAPPAGAHFGDSPAQDAQRLPDELGEADVRVFSVSAGPATHAVLRTTDGEERPALTYQGRIYGWYVAQDDSTDPAVLIGYAADGTEVGRTRA